MKRNSYYKSKTRIAWLAELPEPFRSKAIAAIKHIKKEDSEAFLDKQRTGDSGLDIFIQSILFKDTIEGASYWIEECKKLESKVDKRRKPTT